MRRGPDRRTAASRPWTLAGPTTVTLAAALLAFAGPAAAQDAVPNPALQPGGGAIVRPEISIRVVPDRLPPGDSLTVGDRFWVTVVPSGPSGHYLLPESVPEAYASRPEVAVVGSERRDGRLRLEMALFRPGDVTLPAVEARVVDDAGDTLRVPVVSDTIPVASVLAPGDTLLADIKPLWEPETLPAWVWWVAAAAALAFLALLWWWWRRRRRSEPASVRAPARTPAEHHAEARRRIEAAGARTASPADRIGAAGEIGDALRDYLAGAWGIPARERTTFELLPALPSRLGAVRPALGGVLAQVDLAKFARVDPGAPGLGGLAGRAVGVLDAVEARRVPAEEDEAEAAPAREAAS